MVPENIRIKFKKTGRLKYISHLDLDRTFRTALVRTKIPIWYTEGFNPHAKIVFAQPLPLFAESECELMDVKINEDIPCRELKERLSAAFTEELLITDVYKPKDKFTEIAYAEYSISGDFEISEKQIQEFLTNDINVQKKTKSGEKNVNIRPQIHSIKVIGDGEITAVLDARGESYLNPDIMCKALLKEGSEYSVMRKVWYKKDMTVFE